MGSTKPLDHTLFDKTHTAKRAEDLQKNTEILTRAEHHPKVHAFLQTNEWLPLLMTNKTVLADPTANVWLHWLWMHRERIHGFDELTDQQCKQLSTDLGFLASYKSLHRVESCSIDGTVFLRFGYRQLMKPLEVLSTCVHELVHCLMPVGVNDTLEESLCMIAEICVRKRWLVDDDLSGCVKDAVSIRPAQRCSSAAFGGLDGLKNTLKEIGSENCSLSLLLLAETVEDTILSLFIAKSDLRVCKCQREKRLISRLQIEVFGGAYVPTALEGDELLLVHGDPIKTFFKVQTKGESLYVGSFVSKYQRRGHGSRAMALMLRVAERKGIRFVDLHSRNEPHLRETFLKLGFKILSTVPQFYEDGAPGLFWRKNIAP